MISKMYCAVFANRIDVMELSVDRGAKLNIKNNKGETPLDYANKQKNFTSAQTIITRR